MCLIWSNMHLFSWILVLIMSLYLRDVMTWTLLHFPVSCWLEMDYKTCWTVIGSFMPILRTQTLILFLSINKWFYAMLFANWEIYDMLWCSQCCVIIPMEVPLGGKSTLAWNISTLIKGWTVRSNFNVGRVKVFVTSIS